MAAEKGGFWWGVLYLPVYVYYVKPFTVFWENKKSNQKQHVTWPFMVIRENKKSNQELYATWPFTVNEKNKKSNTEPNIWDAFLINTQCLNNQSYFNYKTF